MMIIHEEPAEYSSWFKLLFLIPVGLFIGAAVSLFSQKHHAPVDLAIEGIVLILLFYFISPRKYQIYHDKVRIVLGAPFGINIPLSVIEEVRHVPGVSALTYSGMRFVTSTKYVMEIVRKSGWNYVISPRNGELFQEQLDRAIKDYSSNRY